MQLQIEHYSLVLMEYNKHIRGTCHWSPCVKNTLRPVISSISLTRQW